MARKPTTDETGNGEKAAKLLNISVPQLYNLANSGQIPKSDNGVWDLAACAHGYIKYLQGRGGDDKRDLTQERTRLTKLQADKVDLENAILRAELIPADIVKTVWTGILGAVRGRLLALPPRLSALGFGAPTAEDLETISADLVHEALNELADFDSTLYRTARARAAGISQLDCDPEAAAKADGKPMVKSKPAPKRGGQRRAGAVQNKQSTVPTRDA